MLDHLAHAPALDLVALARHPNLYLKFSSINIRAHEDAQAYFAGLIEAFGPQRMMWGSDFPHTKGPYTELVELARHTFAFASTEVRDWLFAGTARKLYPALTGS